MKKGEAGRLICDVLARGSTADARLAKLSPADWTCAAGWALKLKAGSLFYRALESHCHSAALVPTSVRETLRNTYRHLAITNTSLFLAASTILKRMAGDGIPVIALKGLALARNVYGDIALRPMCDLDLMVREEDLVRAGRLLLALGYRQECAAWESLLKAHHHLPPFANTHGVMIELHWDIVPPNSPIRVDVEGLWERSQLIKLEDTEARVLSPEDLLLHLCIHACFHLPTGLDLVPLCDIAGLVRSSEVKIDWQLLVERATRWGGRKCAYLMLLLAQELLGAAPPAGILSAIKPDDYMPVFLDEAMEQIFFDESPVGQLAGLRIGGLSRIAKAKGIRAKASALFAGAFPPKSVLARTYPVSMSSPKIYLCYLDRLCRLTAWYATVVLQFCRRDQSTVNALHQANRGSAVSSWMFS